MAEGRDFLLFLALTMVFSSSVIVQKARGNSEGDALHALRRSLSDPDNVLQSCDPNLANPFTYFHITCNQDNRVTRLFLEARNWNTKKASKMLKETPKWRLEYKPEKIKWEDVAREAETGKPYRANYLDSFGRTVLVMRPGFEFYLRYNVVCLLDASEIVEDMSFGGDRKDGFNFEAYAKSMIDAENQKSDAKSPGDASPSDQTSITSESQQSDLLSDNGSEVSDEDDPLPYNNEASSELENLDQMRSLHIHCKNENDDSQGGKKTEQMKVS